MGWYPQFIFRVSGPPVPPNVDGTTKVTKAYMDDREGEITAIEEALGVGLVVAGDHLSDTLKVRNGNVGIGEPTPDVRLVVSGFSSSEGTPIMRVKSTGSQVPLYLSSGNADAYVKGDAGGGLALGAEGAIAFETGGFGWTKEKVRVTTDGKVGIGTTNPTAKLDVDGPNIRIRQWFLESPGSLPAGELGEIRLLKYSDSYYIYVKTDAGWKGSQLT